VVANDSLYKFLFGTILLTSVRKYTWSGYEVPSMILLYILKGVMQLDRSKDISVHVTPVMISTY